MSNKFDPEIKRLAKDRGHSYLYIRLDTSTLKPEPGNIYTFQRSLSLGREQELVDLIVRWREEDVAQRAASAGVKP